MKGFVHLRTSLFLVISVTRVFLVTSQDATGGKWTFLFFLFLEIDLYTLPLTLSEAGWTTVRYTAYSTAEGSSFGEMRFRSWYISKLLGFFFSTTEPKWIVLVHCFNQSRTVPGVAGFWWTAAAHITVHQRYFSDGVDWDVTEAQGTLDKKIVKFWCG